MAKPMRAWLRELGQRAQGIPAAAAAPVPISRARGQTGQAGRRRVGAVLGLGALMSVAGGVAPQRPDQALDSSSAGVAPGTATGTLRAILAIIGGTGPAVTGVFVYNGAPGASDLIASMTNSPTDPFGTTTYRSVAAYQSGLERVAAQLSAGAVIFNRGAAVVASPASVGSNDSAPLIATSGQVNASDVQCSLALGPALAGGVPVAALSGTLELFESAAPPAASGIIAGPQLFGTVGGHAAVVDDALNGDGNTYQLGENVYRVTVAQTISTVANVGITGITQHVVAGATYYFEGIIRCKQGAVNNNQLVGFTGPATSFSTWYYKIDEQSSATGGAWVVVGGLATQPLVFTAANQESYFEVKGTVTFSASGTFQGAASAPVAADTWVIQPGTFWKVRRTG